MIGIVHIYMYNTDHDLLLYYLSVVQLEQWIKRSGMLLNLAPETDLPCLQRRSCYGCYACYIQYMYMYIHTYLYRTISTLG